LLESLITQRTRAIVPVHYAGVGCEMDNIMAIANRHGVAVIEDNAHGLFGSYRGKKLGTFGSMSTLSFHETKNISSGEGGALVINDASLVERAEIIREKGTNRSTFLRGQVDKYTWVDAGSSFLMSDLLAAVLLAQLERASQIQKRRREIWDRYHESLLSWSSQHGIRMPYVPAYCDQAYHMFYLLMPSLDTRTQFIAHLRDRQIMAVFHYVPLHSAPMSVTLGSDVNDCPVTNDVSARLVRLPFFSGMSDQELDRVIETIVTFEPAATTVGLGAHS
ncbi:MAG: dTDP-4-amino-4,6-dideoxygalactose transaminase, partial [bacterium]|nr:dTDP-4-amino-4,6-dideoxygalactose transaminase [Candidatus Kapabacteria bacterium]